MDILTADQSEWISDRLLGKRRSAIRPESGNTLRKYLTELVVACGGKCAVLELPLRFDKVSRTSVKGVRGAHVLSVSLDHVSPGSSMKGHQLICHFSNDAKTNLPSELFEALVRTPEFQLRKRLLQQQFKNDPEDMDKLLFVWKEGKLPQAALPEAVILAGPSLAQGWLGAEADEAWKHLDQLPELDEAAK